MALFAAERQICYIYEWLEEWKQKTSPIDADFRLAQEIAFGSMRMKLALDAYALQLSETFKAKPKILALMRTAIYQAKMMDKIPLYAIVNETVKLAKKHFSIATANFMNALLRTIETADLHLPGGDSLHDLSTRFSYPIYLVQLYMEQFGRERTQELLRLGNLPPILMARELQTLNFQTVPPNALMEFASSPQYYIQNRTPANLFKHLADHSAFHPKKILDLCAAPGGKLLLAHEAYPDAALFANDVSEKKLTKLKNNLYKYHINAELSCGPAEEYSSDSTFDLIILDVPCSNTGVLNKRPEARWRMNKETLLELVLQSKKMVKRAIALLNPNGKIWLMTCSILEEENNLLIQEMSEQFSLNISSTKLILPNESGEDGGFAAVLSCK